MRSTPLLLLVTVLLGVTGVAFAQQDWPVKPVRLIVANAPGAAVDVGARIVANSLSLKLGQAVNVDNRPGADGILAAETVMRAAPDGYTLFFASLSVTSIDPHTRKSLPFNVERDFTPLAVLVDDAGAIGLFAHPSNPFTTVQEMIAYARANPGKLTIATAVPFIAMLASWIDKRAGIQMVQVPYKSSAQAGQDVLAGRVSLYMTNFGFFENQVKTGKIRAIAVTIPVGDWPQIPALSNVIPGFTFANFFTLAGPGGMPVQLARRINSAVATVVEDPSFNKDIAKLNWRNVNGARTPEGTAEYLRQESANWARIVKEIGLQPQ